MSVHAKTTAWATEVVEAAIPLFKVGGAFLVAVVVIAYSIGGYQELNRRGWISHDHDTPVWIEGDWMVGELRDCQMRTKTVPDKRKDLDSLEKLPRLFCGQDAKGLFDFQREIEPPSHPIEAPPEGAMYLIGVTSPQLDQNFHLMPVRYSGRIDWQDRWVISWQCQRKSESLECKALD